jgi:hypothetical protein
VSPSCPIPAVLKPSLGLPDTSVLFPIARVVVWDAGPRTLECALNSHTGACQFLGLVSIGWRWNDCWDSTWEHFRTGPGKWQEDGWVRTSQGTCLGWDLGELFRQWMSQAQPFRGGWEDPFRFIVLHVMVPHLECCFIFS